MRYNINMGRRERPRKDDENMNDYTANENRLANLIGQDGADVEALLYYARENSVECEIVPEGSLFEFDGVYVLENGSWDIARQCSECEAWVWVSTRECSDCGELV